MKTDRAMTVLFICILIMIPLNFFFIFSVAPTEKVMGDVQRIFYLHISMAVGALLALTGMFVSSILFLWKKKFIWDTAAYTFAEIGVLMSTLVLTTGSIWARPIWNTWWTWDPRLLTVLILWFIYVGYFLLRGGIADKFKKAQYSAVLGIIGYIDIPVVRYATKWWKSIHPLLTQEGGGLNPVMKKVMLFSMTTFILVTIFLFIFRFRLARIEERLQIVKKRMED